MSKQTTDAPAPSTENTDDATSTPDPIETGAASFFAKAFEKMQAGEPEAAPEPVASPTPAETAPTEPAGEKTFSALETLGKALGKQEEPATAEPNLDDDTLPEDVAKATEKAKTSWRQLKDVLKTRTKEVEALRKEYEEFKKTAQPVDDSELKALRARVEEQESALRVSKVEATAEYREAVVEPLSQIRASVTKLAEKHGLSVRDVADAMNETDPDRQAELLTDLAAGLPDFDRIRLYEMAKENSKVLSLKQRVLANADEAMRRIEKAHADEAAKAKEATAKERTQAVEAVWNDLQSVAPLFREQEGNEPWNKVIAGLREEIAAVDVDSLNTVDRVRLATRSTVAPVALRMLNELYEAHQKVVAELASIKKATPKAGGQTTDPGVQGAKTDDPNMTFADRIKMALQG